MRASRRIPLSVHGLVELAAGLGLVVASLALDLGAAGIVAVFVAGVVLAGIGLGAAEGLSLAAHQSLDRWLATALAIASIGLALGGESGGSIVLLAVAAGVLGLTATTRWTRPVSAGPPSLPW